MKKINYSVLLIMLVVNISWAQGFNTGSGTATIQSGKSVVTFPVQIWGEVARPGVYDVPSGSDFLAAISYAGGPTDMAKLTDVRLIRAKMLEGESTPMVKIDVEAYLVSGDKKNLPEIRPGDTIIVSPRFWKGIRISMGNVQAVLSLFNAIVLIQYYSGR